MRALGIAAAAVAVATVLAIPFRARVLQAIGDFLIVSDPPAAAGAIVVLSGSVPDRILEAVDLYKAGLAPRLVLTREPPLPGSAALHERGISLLEPHEQNIRIATELGVPADVMSVLPGPVTSTIAEAKELVPYLEGLGVQRILLVTSKAHARRSRMIFRAVAGDRLQIAICPSRYDPFNAATWWQNRAFVRRVAIEYGKLLTFFTVDQWSARTQRS